MIWTVNQATWTKSEAWNVYMLAGFVQTPSDQQKIENRKLWTISIWLRVASCSHVNGFVFYFCGRKNTKEKTSNLWTVNLVIVYMYLFGRKEYIEELIKNLNAYMLKIETYQLNSFRILNNSFNHVNFIMK